VVGGLRSSRLASQWHGFEEALGAVVVFEEGIDFGAEGGVGAAAIGHGGGAVGGRQVAHGFEDLLDLLPALRGHEGCPREH